MSPAFGYDSIPAPVGRRVSRPDLTRRLETSTHPLTLVTAPSGFGKTDAMAAWAGSTAADVAWLTCRQGDQSPSFFWQHLIGTLGHRWPTFGSDSSLILRRPSWEDEALVPALARDLADVPARAVVVVDDSHHAEPAHRTLAALARRLPSNVRIVMASQHNPVFSTTRLRLDGVVGEVRIDELAFSPSEVDRLFALAGVDIAAEDRRRLHVLTEGWPAGLQMALLAMREAVDPRAVVDAFASTTKETSDYLANEVIARLPPELVDFMARISVLDEFDLDLCRAVTQNEDAGAVLDHVVANDLFVYQLDVAGERFRFHQMFAAYLRNVLKRSGDGEFERAHQRAGDALQARGDRTGALRHAMVAGDITRAASVVTQSFGTILEVDDAQQTIGVARAWLARFATDALADDPEQFLQFVYLLAACGQREAERWLLLFGGAHPEPEPRIAALAEATWAALNLNRGNAESALAHNAAAAAAAAGVTGVGGFFPKLAELPMQAAAARLLMGDLAGAEEALTASQPLMSAPLIDEVRSPAVRQWVLFLQGDLVAAHRLRRQLLAAATEHHAVSNGVGLIFTGMVEAGFHLEHEELDLATDELARARHGADLNGRPVILTMADRWLARVATAKGDLSGATAALAQARVVLGGPTESVRAQLAAEEFRLAVELSPADADAMLPLLPDDDGTRLLRARLAVRRRDWAAATTLLALVAPRTIREQVDWGLLTSLSLQERDLAAAHRQLAETLTLAQPHGYLATVIRSGVGIRALLASMPTPASLRDYVHDLVKAADRIQALPRVAERTRAHTLLTGREIDVLRLLSSRLTTQEIAETLFISPNTLKSHMKSVYLKLNVNSRAEAMSAADSRDLL